MSVICQNFVQNAWKKDLCSNCFKSVGDHDVSGDSNGPISHQNESLNGRSHTANLYSSNSNGTPHTTWKSLISERNQKNSQPFKLENGFQGRLLTINKATHPNEKKPTNDCNLKNGHSTNGSQIESPAKTTFSQSKTINSNVSNGTKPQTNGESVNGTQNGEAVRDVNKMQFNGVKNMLSEIESKNGRNQNQFRKEAPDDSTSKPPSPVQKNAPQQIMNDKSEDQPSPLQGILKKKIPIPEVNNPQPRRSSNVGFKDEEPLVIGYGGRDFSPEELEWEMNCSDGENETGTDSLDETEDDKAFSKITKLNTEFNSDNANLLIQQQQIKDAEKTVTAANTTVDGASKSTSPKNIKNETKGDSKSGNENASLAQSNLGREAANEKEVPVVNRQEVISNQIEMSKENGSSSDSEVKDWEVINERDSRTENKESINVAIKNCERDTVTSKEIVVVDTAKKLTALREEENENNSELGETEASPPPPITSRSGEGDSEVKTSENSVMLSDGDDVHKVEGENNSHENGEWQRDNNEIAGQILQAINTSLTNRHKMNSDQESNASNSAEENGKEFPVNDGADKDNFEIKPANCESVTITVSDSSSKKVNAVSEKTLGNVEPRPSFLHGRVSNCKAIYGPASDLFVSRSNSSSSSSSDECNRAEVSHSISVTINGKNTHKRVVRSASEELLNVVPSSKQTLTDYETDSSVSSKFKPRIPAKPSKRCTIERSSIQIEPGHYAKPTADIKPLRSERRKSESSISQNSLYYSTANDSSLHGPSSITLVDHYAESNIYHEVMLDAESRNQVGGNTENPQPKRESKLAALAIELEQVRHPGNNTKRQAPAPPKIPDPPLEDPPSSTGRISPSDNPLGFSSYRGEAMTFSSSSSTASTSSQDTETGYASWNLNGDIEEKRKHSKSKSSFLLAQYSKCKMLAMGYAEDSAKSRKKFSIKKLLKIRKDGTENNAAFDSSCPNPKAWKYNEHYDRPRAKLEIIHPMDLENKSVTVNPGFDSLHSGSLSSFTASADDLSLRNSVSSDYGSFYSDAMSPTQDMKPESNYECIQPSGIPELEDQGETEERVTTCNSNSPTPSRSSNTSQASTVTSESSKNGSSISNRPPKPPPPPRAHSLLPRSKPQNPDGTFKFPVSEHKAPNEEDIQPAATTKPQAPKRQCKAAAPRPDFGIYDNTGMVPPLPDPPQLDEDDFPTEVSEDAQEIGSSTILDIRESHTASQNKQESSSEKKTCKEESFQEPQVSVLSLKPDIQTINVTVKNTPSNTDKNTKSAVTRNKHPPITKAPSRPPPIYMKPQLTVVAKNPNPWKTLEDSYLVLTTSNRELLVKLVTQALKKRKSYVTKLKQIEFRWSHFEIDLAQPSSIFAFGEKIAYHATIPHYPDYLITLVVTVQQAHNRLNESGDFKYPVFGQFVDCIPPELLDSSGDAELESMQATILVLDRSNITTIECFTEGLPNTLTEEHEKELSFIILQLIHSLKSLQAQGIESIDSSFQNLILAKTKADKYNTLIFLSDNCYDENDYVSDSCKISLCQYALMLLFQLLGIQSIDEFISLSDSKFSSDIARKSFEMAIALLSEEKAVSLSQTKTLMECFLWDLTKILEILDDSDDTDSILQRWMDVKRSNFIKNIVGDENLCDINVQSEYYSQFLIRTSIRNVKEILLYL
ncbi:titin homolog [Parasteatoda tepidariorum]|uniref:titin homolog n=1 Tax=Parasteatoda tepidariorum TaxID=114398 RepID=UPI001C71E40F|nr:uncharacterized protein LOC107447458 [Parasteatoda tepidariorum]XP_042898414.1 uncharacterized protein LOC107447458 [Parasteatoda tepidariorum]XP_042898415.1 uncharacterized protein LOC107447458 [Parasteatoda tepidariorum]XP_042898416.1 uncharacterized protein LOC107447458 [Parasteatoda tepidariorum]